MTEKQMCHTVFVHRCSTQEQKFIQIYHHASCLNSKMFTQQQEEVKAKIEL